MTAGRAGAAVWLLALGQTLIYAGSYYAFPALLPDLLAETGWSEAQLALGPTLAFLVMAVGTPLTGRLVDRGFGGELLIWAPVVAALALRRWDGGTGNGRLFRLQRPPRRRTG